MITDEYLRKEERLHLGPRLNFQEFYKLKMVKVGLIYGKNFIIEITGCVYVVAHACNPLRARWLTPVIHRACVAAHACNPSTLRGWGRRIT